jgi:hypothetical protein
MLGNFGSPSVSLVGVTDRFAYQRKKAIIRPKGQTTAIKTEPKFFLRRYSSNPPVANQLAVTVCDFKSRSIPCAKIM